MAKDYFSDFSPKCMSFGGAFLSLSIAVFTYILLPLSGISLLTAIGPEITAAMGEDTIDFSMLLDQIAMYLSKQHTKAPLTQIGAAIGGRNHATVLHSCKAVANLMETDKSFLQTIEEIDRRVTAK